MYSVIMDALDVTRHCRDLQASQAELQAEMTVHVLQAVALLNVSSSALTHHSVSFERQPAGCLPCSLTGVAK